MTTSVPLHRLHEYLRQYATTATVTVVPELVVTAGEEDVANTLADPDSVGLPVCNTCGVTFDDFVQQRQHFRSPEHLETVRKGGIGRAKDQMSKREGGGSGGGDGDDEIGGDGRVSSAEPSSASEDADTSGDEDEESVATGPIVNIHCPTISKTVTLWRTTVPQVFADAVGFGAERSGCEYELTLPQLLSAATALPRTTKWMVLLFRSGYFAGSVFTHSGTGAVKSICHKVLHRYTTRRKQGGAQSTHDAEGGKARSAGAWIRRQNTVALREDIHALLKSWVKDSADCDRVYIAASKRTISTLWCEALVKEDPRIRKVFTKLSTVTIKPLVKVDTDPIQQQQLSGVGVVVPTVPLPMPVTVPSSVPTPSTGTTTATTRSGGDTSTIDHSLSSVVGHDVVMRRGVSGEAGEGVTGTGYGDIDRDGVRAPIPQQYGLTDNEEWVDKPDEMWIDSLCDVCEKGQTQYALMMLHEVEPDPGALLSQYGLDPALLGVNCRRMSDGRTSLHCAVTSGNAELVLGLLNRGADPTLRDFTGRLAFSLANPQLQAQMRTHIQQHVDEWPYKVCGVVPGVKAKAPKGGSKAVTPTKSSGGITPSVAPKQQPQSQKKKKGSKKGKSGPKTTTGTTSREASDADDGDDDDDAVLEAALREVSAMKTQAEARVTAYKKQQHVSELLVAVASRLAMSESVLIDMLQSGAEDGSFDLMEALTNVTAALDAGLGVDEVLASMHPSAMGPGPVTTTPPITIPTPISTPTVVMPMIPTVTSPPVTETVCVECGVGAVKPGSTQPVCDAQLCVRKHRAKLLADAAQRRNNAAATTEK